LKLNKYAADEIAGKLPKGVTATATLTIKLRAKCSACGETHELEEETDGRYNAPFAIRNRLKFTTVKTDRDRRSDYTAEYILCPDCNRIAHDFMQGKINLKEESIEAD
jgi:hypothetical protein